MNNASTMTALPKASAILGDAWRIYKSRLGTFLGIMLISNIVPVLLIGALIVVGLFLGFKLPPPGSLNIGIILSFLIVFSFIMIVYTWGVIALIYAIKDSDEGIGIKESYRKGWHKILSFWWVSFLLAFILIGGFILIVPGIIFAIWFSLSVFVLIAEDIKGMDALLKSREYVKGRWGSVFWRFLFIVLISMIIMIILSVPAIIFGLLRIPFVGDIINSIIPIFLTPLVMMYSFLVYRDLKSLKGEFPFTPSGRTKAGFIFTGIMGLFIIITVPLFLAYTGYIQTRLGKKEQAAAKEPVAEKVQPAETKKQIKAPEETKKVEQEVYAYEAKGKRDPFLSLVIVSREKPIKKKGVSPVENYDVEELKLIAIAWDKEKYYALIMLPDNKFYTVTEGMILGLYGGKVQEITRDTMIIREYVKDYRGDTKSKDTILKLRKEEEE
ncbi:MAG: pilus assembly protein PilP [Nitrospirae bacterium]|nr:pilus assembly protein PilP [Nitrospirota bacterium]